MAKFGRIGGYRPSLPRRIPGVPRPRRSNPLTGVELGEDVQRYIEGGENAQSWSRPATSQPESKQRHSVVQVLLLAAVSLLALGAVALIVPNLFVPDPSRGQTVPEPSAPAAAQAVSSAAPAAGAPPVTRATSPVEAVKLMLRASAKGDTRTAYAQWDIRPEDIVTMERGVQITLAEQIEELASAGAQTELGDYQYRVSQQSATEARVSRYHGKVLAQVYSLRRVGPYWKLYNAWGPDR
jgi:hypothetical protein